MDGRGAVDNVFAVLDVDIVLRLKAWGASMLERVRVGALQVRAADLNAQLGVFSSLVCLSGASVELLAVQAWVTLCNEQDGDSVSLDVGSLGLVSVEDTRPTPGPVVIAAVKQGAPLKLVPPAPIIRICSRRSDLHRISPHF